MSEKKVVGRRLFIGLEIVCIILIACLVGATSLYSLQINDKDNTITSLQSQLNDLNATYNSYLSTHSHNDSDYNSLSTQNTNLQNQNNQLQTWLDGNETLLNQTQANYMTLLNQISPLTSQVSQLNSNITDLQNQVNNLTSILNRTEPYVNSQLLAYPPTGISANGRVEDWILNWTRTTDMRVIRIQVWMGNPSNVTWEGDTYVTIGKPSDPSNSSSYNDSTQLLVHYQFDSHAQSPIPHQLMFDLTPGFKVASGQTINVYRLFVNTEPYNVTAGDVQVIIYYENT